MWIPFEVDMILVDTFYSGDVLFGYVLVEHILQWILFVVGMICVDTFWLDMFCSGYFLWWI